MKVFQIFSHPLPPCEPFAGYMRGIRDMAMEYTLIAPSNFMGAGFYPLESLRAEIPQYLINNPNGLAFDALRAFYLSRHFDHVYLDVDVELNGLIPIATKVQSAGDGILVGNGVAEDGLAAWETYQAMAPNFCRAASLMFSGMPRSDVSPELFEHHYAKGNYFP